MFMKHLEASIEDFIFIWSYITLSIILQPRFALLGFVETRSNQGAQSCFSTFRQLWMWKKKNIQLSFSKLFAKSI